MPPIGAAKPTPDATVGAAPSTGQPLLGNAAREPSTPGSPTTTNPSSASNVVGPTAHPPTGAPSAGSDPNIGRIFGAQQPLNNYGDRGATHVFFGDVDRDINRRTGVEVVYAGGFHSRHPSLQNTTARVIAGTVSPPDKNGVYTANVEIYDQSTGQWIRKRSISSFFPDNWPPEKIDMAIHEAYLNRVPDPAGSAGSFLGTSNGVTIQIIVDSRGAIVTAYPLAGR